MTTTKPRAAKRLCKTCNHSSSFHSDGGPCRGFGCRCEKWQPRDDEATQPGKEG